MILILILIVGGSLNQIVFSAGWVAFGLVEVVREREWRSSSVFRIPFNGSGDRNQVGVGSSKSRQWKL